MSNKLPKDCNLSTRGIRAIIAPDETADDEDVRAAARALFYAAKAGHEVEIFRGVREAAIEVGELNLAKALDMMIEGFDLAKRLRKPGSTSLEHFPSLEEVVSACEATADARASKCA